jgi:hypothetical protein
MKEILKVLEAMRSEELATPLTIKGAQKERIAISAGVVSELLDCTVCSLMLWL